MIRLSGYQQGIVSAAAGAGSLLAAVFVGLAVMWHGTCLDGGTPANPGPNLVPVAEVLLLVVAITGIGFGINAISRRREDKRAFAPAVWGLVLSIIGVVCFSPAACVLGAFSGQAAKCV